MHALTTILCLLCCFPNSFSRDTRGGRVRFGIDTDPARVCAADLNGDGVVDLADEDLLILCILWGRSDTVCAGGDLDADGVVHAADLPQFITALLDGTTDPQELCASDLNRDGWIDGLDIQPMVNCLLDNGSPNGGPGDSTSWAAKR